MQYQPQVHKFCMIYGGSRDYVLLICCMLKFWCFVQNLLQMFHHLFHLELEEDLNEVVFALKTESCIPENRFPEAVDQLSKLLNLEQSRFGKPIIDAAKKIKRIV